MLRGGAFNNQPMNVRTAYRNNNQSDNRNNNNGFRPASTLRQNCLSSQNSQAVLVLLAERASAKFRSSSRVGPVSSSSAKSTIDPAGLVDRKVRTPCRVILF